MPDWISNLPDKLAVIIVAALPVFELRGSIPLGFYLKMPVIQVFILSIIGNLLPVIPWLFILEPVSNYLRKFSLFKRFFDWLFERTRKKADLVQKYEAVGLALFVAAPFPMTGAWSGAIAASLFKIKFRYALSAIFLGVILAAIIVTTLCLLGKITWHAYK
ncbi:MAG: small multi-drug export protein [Candidatus Omnitrophica bacterium]|nr:small multi-drug export protein [Candidatus Omnitrophota bacterium]